MFGLFYFSSSFGTQPFEVWCDSLCSVKQTKGYEEEQDLVVLQGAAQPHKGDQEQEDPDADDPRHHSDAGNQVKPFPPTCHSNQQQTHQLRRKETMLREEGTCRITEGA